jgi:tetratricopeptide (TPR) repeat protein
LRALVSGDGVSSTPVEPELAEQRRRLESLGYAAGGAASQESEAIDPKDGIAWIAELEAGRRAYQIGQPQDGIAPLRRLLARNPNNVQALLALAMCYLGSGRPGDAVRIDRRALEIRPDDDLVHFNLANALAASGEHLPEARRHYERALQLNPRFADAYLNYASLLERSDAAAEALDLLERARAAGVRDPDLETRLAVLELRKGNVEAAEQAFRRALDLHPRDAGPLEAMARISSRRGRFAESAAFYEKLLDVAPSAATARSLGSIRLDRLDDPAGARIAYLRALALTAPGDPEREALQALIDELAQHP